MKDIRRIPLAEAIAEAHRAMTQPDYNVSPQASREIFLALLPAAEQRLATGMARVETLQQQLTPPDRANTQETRNEQR